MEQDVPKLASTGHCSFSIRMLTVTSRPSLLSALQLDVGDGAVDDFEKQRPSRKQKSLGLLCQKFLARYPSYPLSTEKTTISLDEVAVSLGMYHQVTWRTGSSYSGKLIFSGRLASDSLILPSKEWALQKIEDRKASRTSFCHYQVAHHYAQDSREPSRPEGQTKI